MLRATVVQIDRSALKHNLELLKKWNGPDAFFCPMAKADAYGHGAEIVARVVQDVGASALGVALFEEGLALREVGIRMPIVVFSPLDKVAASCALTHQLTPVVGRCEDLEALLQVGGKSPLKIHLKFNTGMNRLGFDSEELPRLREYLRAHPLLSVEGVCTHLSHGNEAHLADGHTSQQLAKFAQMSQGFAGLRHAHKSSSLMALAKNSVTKEAKLGARPGIALYGLGTEDPGVYGLKPALRWTTRLVRAHVLQKGESAGYGARWTAPRKSVIGIVPVGYGDGYLRALSGKGEMLFRQMRVPVVGSVCMDYTLLDLTEVCRGDIPTPGEEVVIIGSQGREEIRAAGLAKQAGTIDYEIVTAISRRVPREVL